MKRLIAIVSLMLFGTNPVVPCYPTGYGYYPSAAVVINLDYEADVITVQDSNGFVYSCNGCEDYTEGDIVSLIMDSMGTPDTVLDDKILDMKYSGYWME